MGVLENLVEQDPEFAEAKFRSKVENEFVQIKLAIVTGKTERVKHYVSDEIYEKIVAKVEEDKANNRIQLYDELNVFNVSILEIKEFDDCFTIDVNLTSRALEYYINRETRQYMSGNNQSRVEKPNHIVFRKKKDAKRFNGVQKCPSCGASMDINENGKCKFCGMIIPLENYDWTIISMDI